MTEGQSKHRRDLESRNLASDVLNSKLGLILGFVIAIVALGVAAFIAVRGQPWTGGIIGWTAIAGLVATFVYGSRARRKEREGRRQGARQ